MAGAHTLAATLVYPRRATSSRRWCVRTYVAGRHRAAATAITSGYCASGACARTQTGGGGGMRYVNEEHTIMSHTTRVNIDSEEDVVIRWHHTEEYAIGGSWRHIDDA